MAQRSARRLVTALLALIATYLLVSSVAGVVMMEGALRVQRQPLHDISALERRLAASGVSISEQQITADDGAKLHGVLVTPKSWNGKSVVLIHGVTDNYTSMIGFAAPLADMGLQSLAIDSRAHGRSGDEIATYGVLEANDIARWVQSLYRQPGAKCVYGFGGSMGAALILQGAAASGRMCGVIAEAPFESLRAIANERIAERAGIPAFAAAILFRPALDAAFLYARIRYGVEMDRASPIRAASELHVPVLLISGGQDLSIRSHHSAKIAAVNPQYIEHWNVPEANHTNVSAVRGQEFYRKVFSVFGTSQP